MGKKPEQKKADLNYVEVFVASLVKWEPGLSVRSVWCVDHPRVLEAPDALAPLGRVTNLKKAKMPYTNMIDMVCAVAALTREEALATLKKGVRLQIHKTSEQLGVFNRMADDMEKSITRGPPQLAKCGLDH